LVDFIPKCGHLKRNVRCSTKHNFIQKKETYQCLQHTKLPCPICKSEIPMLCWQAQILKKWVPGIDTFMGYIPEVVLTNCPRPEFDMKFINSIQCMCTSKHDIERNCYSHHRQIISCTMIIKILLGVIPLEECQIKFHTFETYQQHCDQQLHSKHFYRCDEITKFVRNSPTCTALIKVTRSCKHTVEIPCHLNKKYLVNEWSIGPGILCPNVCTSCTEPVNKETAYVCHEYFVCLTCLARYIKTVDDDVKDTTKPSYYITEKKLACICGKNEPMDLYDHSDTEIKKLF
jgi:hypothetical protein